MLRDQFELDGHVTINGVLEESVCDSTIDHLVVHYDLANMAGVRNLMSEPVISDLASDPVLLDLTKQLTGRVLVPYKATLFNKTDEQNWLVSFHQDTALPVESASDDEGWGPVSVKEGVTYVHAPTEALNRITALRIHLDPSTQENGPLRVIPGSHRKRLRSAAEFDAAMKINPQVECFAEKGGVIAMRPMLLHASSKSINNYPRRVLHIEYAESITLTEDIKLRVA